MAPAHLPLRPSLGTTAPPTAEPASHSVALRRPLGSRVGLSCSRPCPQCPRRRTSSSEAAVDWPGREWPPSPCPFSPPWLWEQALAPSSARHLGGWREPPPAALTAFKGTARNRRGHPTACVGLAASECPFCRLSVHFAKSAQPRLPCSSGRGCSRDRPLLPAPENAPRHLPTARPGRCQPACLLANRLRPLVSQPDAEAPPGSKQRSTGLTSPHWI